MSGIELNPGEGVPYVHESFELVGVRRARVSAAPGCTCTGVECSVRAAERREFEMPLRDPVIRFPDEADRGGCEHTALEVGANRSEALCWLEEGTYLVREHRIPEAITAYAEAQARDSTLTMPARYWDRLCGVGSLWEHAAEVMPACEQAVALKPDNGEWSSNRGLARALTAHGTRARRSARARTR